ncbi:hypothetical protein RHSIM_Rhsim04G0213600 [Rhododendron simsii]|uniref:F-box domain-containing protein n=1 Tax=Rhododendron simsii TaxID=118357 RepID=A0A834GZ39_RHOSS|nr:hypothetical protein RHSIM_Rhsim04G0213600 [Rhododendron simsii]
MTRRIGTKHRSDVRSELQFALETEEGIMGNQDYISELPDECLACVFKFLRSSDRKNASLVSKQMLKVEGQSRRRLTLSAAQSDFLPSLLSRFDAVTELVVQCHRSSIIDVDDMLILIGKHCGNNNRIKELVLIGVNVSCVGLESVARNFPKLERLTLRGRSKTGIGDAEISYVASNCVGLKKLYIKGCPVTNQGIKAFGFGCPKLVEIKVEKCRGVTSELCSSMSSVIVAKNQHQIYTAGGRNAYQWRNAVELCAQVQPEERKTGKNVADERTIRKDIEDAKKDPLSRASTFSFQITRNLVSGHSITY